MPVIVKSPGTNFLNGLGVNSILIDKMNAGGLKLVLGYKEFSLVNKEDEVVTKGTLDTPVNMLVKLPTPETVGPAKKTLETAIAMATGSGFSQSGSGATAKIWPAKAKVDPGIAIKEMLAFADAAQKAAKAAEEKVKAADAAQKAKVEFNATQKDQWKAAGILNLKDATELYQRVHGTSGNSVYVTVALGSNVKIAARIKGNSLSVRAEGVFAPAVKTALAGQGVQFKGKAKDGSGEYASGHYECGTVPPERVMGAILFGFGLPFDTAIPDMGKVRTLCK